VKEMDERAKERKRRAEEQKRGRKKTKFGQPMFKFCSLLKCEVLIPTEVCVEQTES